MTTKPYSTNLAAFQRFADVLQDPVFLITGDGVILGLNGAAASLARRPVAQLVGQDFAELLQDDPQRIALQLQNWSRTLQPMPAALRWAGDDDVAELRCYGAALQPRSDAAPALLMLRLTPKARSVEQFIVLNQKIDALSREIRERQQAQAELAAQAEELRRSNADLEDFAHIASHDLKEPLRGISTCAAILMEELSGNIDPESIARLHSLLSLSHRMYYLLDALLEYSRFGRGELYIRSVDLSTVVDEVLNSLSARLNESGARVEVASPLPTVACDRIMVMQLLSNLVVNGLKYNRADQKRITIGALPEGPSSVPVTFVRDNGIGIPQRHLDSIFRIFKRLHKREDYGGGTGVGLAIARKIVERHGGAIWVESTPGQGSTFYFTLARGGGMVPQRVQTVRIQDPIESPSAVTFS